MKTYLEFTDARSSKFWEVSVKGSSYVVRYGRIGTDGRTKTKDFSTKAEAALAAEKLAKSKLAKGYGVVRKVAKKKTAKKKTATTKKTAKKKTAITKKTAKKKTAKKKTATTKKTAKKKTATTKKTAKKKKVATNKGPTNLKHVGWSFCDGAELNLAFSDALSWWSRGSARSKSAHGSSLEVFAIGDFYSPVYKSQETLYLMGHHKYADDDIKAFGYGYRSWGDELIASVGAKLVSLRARKTVEVGTIEVASGCLLVIDPSVDAVVSTKSEVAAVVSKGAAREIKLKGFAVSQALLVPLAPGAYCVSVDDLSHVDAELGTFNARVMISPA